MTEANLPARADGAPDQAPGHAGAESRVRVAPSPHVSDSALSTRRMMIDVLIGLVPAMVMAVVVFGWYAVVQVGLCVLSCLVAETGFTWIRRPPDADRRLVGRRDGRDPGHVAAGERPAVHRGDRVGRGDRLGQGGLRRAGVQPLQSGDGRPRVRHAQLRQRDGRTRPTRRCGRIWISSPRPRR